MIAAINQPAINPPAQREKFNRGMTHLTLWRPPNTLGTGSSSQPLLSRSYRANRDRNANDGVLAVAGSLEQALAPMVIREIYYRLLNGLGVCDQPSGDLQTHARAQKNPASSGPNCRSSNSWFD
jgi:hypothetical protein